MRALPRMRLAMLVVVSADPPHSDASSRAGGRAQVERDRCVRVIDADLGTVRGVAWSPDGTRVAVGGDQGVSVWSLEGREVWRQELEPDAHVWPVASSPDGKWIASGDVKGNVRVWSADDGRMVWHKGGYGDRVEDLGWSPVGGQLVVAVPLANVVVVLEELTGREIRRFTRSADWGPTAASWSPDGKRLVTGSGWGERPLLVCVWGEGDTPEVEAEGHTEEVCKVRWAPDGRRVVSASTDGTARLWDALTGAERMRFEMDEGVRPHSVAWSPDGRCVATGNWGTHPPVTAEHHARVWDAATGEVVALLRGHTGAAFSVAFAPDRGLLATASFDGTVRIWDVSDLVDRRWARREQRTPGLAD